MTLAEIIEEARRLDERVRVYHADNHRMLVSALNDRANFYATHFPLLVAVAEAAVEMRGAETVGHDAAKAPYAYGPQAVHRYGCPLTKIGKKYGPCQCGGADIQTRIKASRDAFDAAIRGEGKKP